jgi:hypothetical protein
VILGASAFGFASTLVLAFLHSAFRFHSSMRAAADGHQARHHDAVIRLTLASGICAAPRLARVTVAPHDGWSRSSGPLAVRQHHTPDTACASASSVPDEPAKVLRALNEADGLALHARTAMPGWLGERLDVGDAIDVLHPLAR